MITIPATYGLALDLKSADATAKDHKPSFTASASMVQDPEARKAVHAIESKLAPIKGFTAQTESGGLDPNGGFDSFKEDISFLRPNKMLIKRTVRSAHNADAVGQVITIVIDGTWSYARIDRPAMPPERRKMMEDMMRREMNRPDARKMTDKEKEEMVAHFIEFSEKPSYSKTNLKALEKAGVCSIDEYLSGMNNLLNPFAKYDLKTLKLVRETSSEWIMTAEYKNKNAYWPGNRFTFDKKTGLLKKVEAEIKELKRTITLLDVKKVVPEQSLADSLFKMEIPPSAIVIDQTDTQLMDVEMQKEMEKKQKEPGKTLR